MQQQSWGQLISNLRNNEGDIRHADEAREAISRIADESHVADLYALLQDTDFVIREAAAIPLARLEGVKALPALFLALTRGFQEGCDNDGLSSTVTDLLEAHKSTAAPILLEMLSAADSETRDNAAWALGFISSEITATPLLAALSDVATSVRSSAAGSLASFKNDPRVPEALLKSLLDGDEQVRISAASALGDIGDQRAIGPLKTMLKRCDRKSRPIVEHALEQLGDPVSDWISRKSIGYHYDLDINDLKVFTWALEHPLTQAELHRQQRDLAELETSMTNFEVIRDRARTESAILFDELSAQQYLESFSNI